MKRLWVLAAVVVAGCASRAEKSTAPRAETADTESDHGRAGLVAPEPVDIFVETGDRPLGAYTVRLTYDRECVRVASVTPTDAFRAPDYSDKGFTSGSLTLSAYQVRPGPSGRVVVARVLFEPVAGGGACALLVELVTLVDPEALPIRGRAGTSRIKIP